MTHRPTDPEHFGDAEPEDAWQADDPTDVLTDNLDRRLEVHFGLYPLPRTAPLLDRLEALAALVAAARARNGATVLESHRLDLIAAGITHVLHRLETDG